MSAIEVDSFLPHPPAKVWRALTDPGLMASWLMCRRLRPGGRAPLHDDDRSGAVPGLRRDHPVGGADPRGREPSQDLLGVLRAGLDRGVARSSPRAAAPRLFLTHDGFDETQPGQAATYRILGSGWRGMMAHPPRRGPRGDGLTVAASDHRWRGAGRRSRRCRRWSRPAPAERHQRLVAVEVEGDVADPRRHRLGADLAALDGLLHDHVTAVGAVADHQPRRSAGLVPVSWK